jgi:hypothetical protein
MKLYYIYIKNEQLGPFSYEDLKNFKITKETKVWFEGLEEWKNAIEIEELKHILTLIPPPINSINTNLTSPKLVDISKVESKTVEETKKILGLKISVFYTILSVFVIVVGLAYFINLQNKNREKLLNKELYIQQQKELYNQQQKELEEQKVRLTEQEKIEENRKKREKKEAIEKRINEIIEQLNINYQNLETAKQKLNNISSFKLLRTSTERNEQINTAQSEIDIIKNEIKNLEDEMVKINPNWGNGI